MMHSENWMEINFECDDSRKSISENSSSKTINSAPFHAYWLINCARPVIAHQSSARWNIVNAILRSSYLLSLFDVLPQSFVPSKIRMSLLISASLLNINNYNCTKAHSFPLTLTNNPEFGHCGDGPALRDTRHWACSNSGTDIVIRFSHSDKYLARRKFTDSHSLCHCCNMLCSGLGHATPPSASPAGLR